MLIDWFTVIAQVINFLILVWLLKRFLYHPILNAVDERERRIAKQIQDAETTMAEAKKEQDTFQQKNEEFDQQRKILLKKAMDEVEAQRHQMMNEAKKEFDGLRSKLKESLRNEQQTLSREITRRTREEVFAITRKALTDLASISLEEHMTEIFIHRLDELNEEAHQQLVAALESSARQVTVRSAFEMPSATRRKIEDALKKLISTEFQVHFEITPEQISGIELVTNGYKVAWSIAAYLSSLEDNVATLLKETSEVKPETVTTDERTPR